jgi:RNA polymerase sigma-70 factor (ECF subfamily)
VNAEPIASREHIESCYRYALSLTRDPAAAEDLVQDAWVAVMKSRKPQSTPYMLRVIRNRFIDLRRHDSRWRIEAFEEGSLPEPGEEDVDPVDRVDLERALSSLGDWERSALYMNTVEGRTAAEIADATGRPRGTVLSQLHRTRQKLRFALAGAAAAVLVMLAIWGVGQWPPEQAVAREIAANHGKPHGGAIEGDIGYAGVALALSDLNFQLLEPVHPQMRGLELVSAQYCSVRGEIAAQLTLQSEHGQNFTLYEVDGATFDDLELPAAVVIGDVEVQLWVQDGVFFGLAGPAD